MSRPQRPGLLLCSLLGASLVAGCTTYRGPNAIGQVPAMDSAPVEYTGGASGYSKAGAVDSGYFVPDGRGGQVWMPGNPRQAPDASYAEAQELRLKVRELASQLLDTRTNETLSGLIALPTSFVDLNNFTQTNSLGRYMAEAMFYEFNQRGFPVKEYRLNGKITMLEGAGEFALTRNLPPLPVNQGWAALLLGTYLRDGNGIFINVRLVRPSDGLVLRTAQLVLGNNPLLARMTAPPPQPPKPPFSSGTLRIRSENAVSAPPRTNRSGTRSSQKRRAPAQQSSAAISPARPQSLPSTQNIQAAQAERQMRAAPGIQAGTASSVQVGGDSAGQGSGQGSGRANSQDMYSGPADAVSPGLADSPMPGPAKNT